MKHLTYTGFYAGTPYCGCDKESEKEIGNDFMHIKDKKTMIKLKDSICKDCYRVYDICGKCDLDDCDGCKEFE